MGTFEKLTQEKQDRIINSALVCFGKDGYKKTSVADIAGMAGISKSAIFHYFGSKKSLWLYLYNLAIRLILDVISEKNIDMSDDFFERMYYAQTLKMQVIGKYAGMFSFLYTALQEDLPELTEGRQEQDQLYIKKGFDMLLDGINMDKFRPGVSIRMATDIITWVSLGYIQTAFDKKDSNEMTKEVFEYIELLKTAFYKEEYL